MGSREPTESKREGSYTMYFAGVDVAKRSHELCVINESGSIVLQLSIKNSTRIAKAPSGL